MRTSVAVIAAVTCFLPGVARTQPDTACADAACEVSLHPDIMTVLQLPEDVVRAQTLHRDEFRLGFFASRIYVQPRPDTPAGTEALLEVETRTQKRTILLRVVDHADDAERVFLVRAPEAQQDATEAGQMALPEVAPEPVAIAPLRLPGAPPPPRLPGAGHASAPDRAEPINGRASAAESSPRFDLSVHAILVPMGITALEVPGYVPDKGRRSHRALGLRVAAARRDTWWSWEAGISAERLAAPTVHVQPPGETQPEERRVSGTWLRAEVGMRARTGTRLKPTAYVGLGLQAHLRKIERLQIVDEQRQQLEAPEDMTYGAVLTLGMGLQYQTRDVLLGIDFQMRQGAPLDYRSVEVLLSVGLFLDKENEP